jgi:hypothetical protein
MAKVQTFSDKLKKKRADTRIFVKVIKWYKSEERGSLRTIERLVPVTDPSEIENIDIIK